MEAKVRRLRQLARSPSSNSKFLQIGGTGA